MRFTEDLQKAIIEFEDDDTTEDRHIVYGYMKVMRNIISNIQELRK